MKTTLFRIFYVCLVICAIAELSVEMHGGEHHAFWFQKIPLFHAILGFVSSVVLVLVAKGLGHWLKRDEDHWEREYAKVMR